MAKRKNIKWTPAMEQQLIILRQGGLKPRDIARIMGISRIAVYNRSSKLGVTKVSAQLEMDLQVAPATKTQQVASATKTEFRESPKTKNKPSWFKQMMWWRN
jgi:hypothetical protein